MAADQQSSGKRLYQQVVDQISQLINSGEYPVGSRLPAERELSERFGVSRPTIREAVIALEAKERVSVKVGSGVYVLEQKKSKDLDSNVSPFELKETRVLVEGEAAALAATMITDEQLEALKAALDEMGRENEAGDVTSDVADKKFHAVIAEATNNRVLSSIIEGLWDVQENMSHIKKAHQSVCQANPQERMVEHRRIYDALANRDPQAARLAMRKHFARSINALHAATEQEAVDEVKRRLSAARERFSVDRLTDSTVSSAE
ncbi:FadR family transcriptional regulator [Pseudomaricurvus alkylphenolicus]|jgi:DNA-binding FadR family transcriptional regulator|uniref:FadR/GntR family transcriptional regulator n=1 Tax=Pseudomaricurvus alkylphenolicus TaxID=1306991 RepID=UPI001422EDFA|nr:FadR/GntR family transcriptional regulator [Pseudomaricurvus alkylphenolicus]NIB42542.1 FadR family transcriptional regulator [Pseudomaricurvus alkylphenolicus]